MKLMRFFSAGIGLVLAASICSAAQLEQWQQKALGDLCQRYLAGPPATGEPAAPAHELLDRLSRRIGRQLSAGGLASVPAQDIAMLALLHARLADRATAPSPEPMTTSGLTAVRTQPPAPLNTPAVARETNGQPAGRSSRSPEPPGEGQQGDIQKGEEGYIQAVERLASMPVGERLVMTGDITSGLQAATMEQGPDLTSTFGRARMNFVAQVLPGSPGGRFEHGYFFVQMLAAGGPFDGTAVGGPAPVSSFNDVATDRSAFNEGTARGNVYLSKVYYQQRLNLGDHHAVGRVGIIDFSDYFDANEFANNEARQYINSAMVNSSAFKTGLSAPGVMAEYHRSLAWNRLNTAIVRAGYALSRTERAFSSPVWNGEVELRGSILDRGANLRLGGSLGNVAGVGGVSGFHVSADHWTSRDTGIFIRYARSNTGPGSLAFGPAYQSYGGGFQWRFVDRDDRASAWGAAFSQAFRIRQDDRRAGSEKLFETYYRWQITNSFSLSPDLQLVFGSGGRRQDTTHVVLGVRAHFGF